MRLYVYIIPVLLFTSLFSYAQKGPGGVGTNDGASDLALWLDASNSSNSTLQWFDSSGGNRDFISGGSATLNTANRNGYDSYGFNGTDQFFQRAFDAGINPAELTIFSASNAAIDGTLNTMYSTTLFLGDSAGGFTLLNADIGGGSGERWAGLAGGDFILAPYVSGWSIQRYGVDSSPLEFTLNGGTTTVNANPSGYVPATSTPFILGAANSSGVASDFFEGDIGELIMFNYKLNSAETIIVENYLASKYNINIGNDFHDQDSALAGDFDHDVAGIGRVDAANIHDEAQGTGPVLINAATSLNDDDFLFWGKNTISNALTSSPNVLDYSQAIDAVWRVSERNDVGAVNVSFDLSHSVTPSIPNCSSMFLMVSSSDPSFATNTTTYPMTKAGGFATASGIDFNAGDYFSFKYTDEIVWDGSTWFNGSGSGNRPGTTDSCLKLRILSGGTANINASIHVREIEVAAGGTLNVANNVLLEVEDGLLINGSIDLAGEAQLIQNHTGTSLNSGTGSLTRDQQGTENGYNYNYWSSPVHRGGFWQVGYLEDFNGVIPFHAGLDPVSVPLTLSNRWLYTFPGSVNGYDGWNAISSTTNIAPGFGYTMKGTATGSGEYNYVFKGIPNDGDLNIVVGSGEDILIGNPYTSALDANQFLTDNATVINGSLYFWEGFTGNTSHDLRDYEGGYATYNGTMGVAAVAGNSDGPNTSVNGASSKGAPDRFVSVGQGFFVVGNGAGGTINFNNAQRSFQREVEANSSPFYRQARLTSESNANSTVDTRPKIRIGVLMADGLYRTLGLGYDINATSGLDNLYDSKNIDILKNDFYWMIAEQKCVIQGLPQFNVNDRLILGGEIETSGNYSFKIHNSENFPEDVQVVLYDSVLDASYELSENDKVAFDLVASENIDRFSIGFVQKGTNDLEVLSNNNTRMVFLTDTKELLLENLLPEEIDSVKAYNLLGQEVREIEIKERRTVLDPLIHGIYIVKATLKNGQVYSLKMFE